MKYQSIFNQRTLNAFLLVGSFILLSIGIGCKENVLSPEEEAAEDLVFTQIVTPSPFAAAEEISVSPNGQYMIYSYRGGVASFEYYLSKDGGQTVEEISPNISTNTPILTQLSNTGEYIIEPNQHGYIYVITDSGKKVRFASSGSSVFEIENAGEYSLLYCPEWLLVDTILVLGLDNFLCLLAFAISWRILISGHSM